MHVVHTEVPIQATGCYDDLVLRAVALHCLHTACKPFVAVYYTPYSVIQEPHVDGAQGKWCVYYVFVQTTNVI